jgi:hypothetical protein
MKITPAVLKEAEEWVNGINKHFKVKRKIVVQAGTDSRIMRFYAQTVFPIDATSPIIIYLYPNKGQKNCPLFSTVYHEMCHILLWPLTGGNAEDSALGRKEEKIVLALEKIMRKVSER